MALLLITLLALLASSSIILSYNGVYGVRSLTTMEEKEEDLELERQLKYLNKPAVKSIKTEYGEIYDCVDFYKQSAFDNPLLKNHKPEMSSSIPRQTHNETSSEVDPLDYLRLDDGGCPSGTVPIRRTTKEDLIRWKSYSNSSENFHQFLDEGPGKHFAGYQLKNENLKYHGGSAYLSIHNPSVSPNQYSGAMIWAQGGQNHVQVGWHVNPKLYGDTKTHFFGHWTADGSQKTGCFNSICSGFVQVNKDTPLGTVISQTSTYGEDPYSVPVFLYQDKKSRNWWIALGEKSTNIGYWPKELFNSIRESAPVVGWRGEVYTPQGEQDPPMGSGHFLSEGGLPAYKKTAYFRAVRVNGDDDIARGPNDASLETVTNGCFIAEDFPYINDFWRHTFFYGGPGGTC
ncbi:uncharacterized protein LOC122086233 [Macadamia integrifolia]|uniref:uncharacterized protein LOC122086233 n=1 Tax=Macadamia integrifolia TaxID=60698 RepID=UPI001C4FBA42|nr:uncharacterized protein LOC122086233 [Macadamia integrifolia]